MGSEQRLHDIKIQLATLQGNHKETLEQLCEKSKLSAGLKNELERTYQQNQAMAAEVRCLKIILIILF